MFFNALRVSGTLLQILLFFLEAVTSLVPVRTSDCLLLASTFALQVSKHHVCFERNFWLWQTKKHLVIENYIILNKINVLMQ